MKHIKDELQAVNDKLRQRVIDYRLADLVLLGLDQTTINALAYYTYQFSIADTCDVGSTNPVVYGMAMKDFITQDYNAYIVANTDMERDFDQAVNEGLSDSFFDFRDLFSTYLQENYTRILESESE